MGEETTETAIPVAAHTRKPRAKRKPKSGWQKLVARVKKAFGR